MNVNESLDELIIYNGINAATGRYAVAPTPLSRIAQAARFAARTTSVPPVDASRATFDPSALKIQSNLRKVGWAVVFPRGTPAAVREALGDLLALRRREAGPLFKILDFDPTTDSFRTWLCRHDVGPGDQDFTRVPLYLLLVGHATEIPFEFQYLLDIEYAVGRVAFDTLEEYAAYARSIVAYASAEAALAEKEIVYWAPRHEGDAATELSSDQLIAPLIAGEPDTPPPAARASVRTSALVGDDAQKQRLLDVLHRPEDRLPPAMLFTASHGLEWPSGHAKQEAAQGALLAQDWTLFDDVAPRHYIAAADIKKNARVHGLMAFMFACFSAGSPARDSYRRDRSEPGEAIAPEPLTAALPRRLLTHPNGGALAVIGHVDRAWGSSIRPAGGKRRIGPFRTCIERILRGVRVGLATVDLSRRYATLSTWLACCLDETGAEAPSDRDLAWAWIERNDAQGYVVAGDPAARLRLDLLR